MKTVHIKLTSATTFAGQIVRAGRIVEVSEAEARDLLRRGKAELATDADSDDDIEQVEDLSKLSKAQLVEHATQLMVEDADKMTKAEILAALQARAAHLAE